ncbi:hypothetical protein [Luteimonas cucumeris]|uniref:hypothetical protein n=1 Tax=Luteimonas cucumeris TaxID=985012 RepID=UPI0011A241C9|nr:hypothetical protein [Luteimonas cucumeris]
MDYCFYLDWKSWSPEVWAALAQAFLTALSIPTALYVVHVQHRLALRQRAKSVVILLKYAMNIALAAERLADKSVGTSFFDSYREATEVPLLKQLEEIPVWDLPLSALAAPVLDAVAYFGRVAHKISDIRAAALNGINVHPDDVVALRQGYRVIAHAHDTAAVAVESFSIWGWRRG